MGRSAFEASVNVARYVCFRDALTLSPKEPKKRERGEIAWTEWVGLRVWSVHEHGAGRRAMSRLPRPQRSRSRTNDLTLFLTDP